MWEDVSNWRRRRTMMRITKRSMRLWGDVRRKMKTKTRSVRHRSGVRKRKKTMTSTRRSVRLWSEVRRMRRRENVY